MRHYAQYDENGTLVAIGNSVGNGTEITEEEYNGLLAVIQEKAALVDRLYNGEITAEDIREDWRVEIQNRVEARIKFRANEGGDS